MPGRTTPISPLDSTASASEAQQVQSQAQVRSGRIELRNDEKGHAQCQKAGHADVQRVDVGAEDEQHRAAEDGGGVEAGLTPQYTGPGPADRTDRQQPGQRAP